MIRFVVRKIRASRQNKDAQDVNETTPDPGVDAHTVNDQHETGKDDAAKASEVPIDEQHAESQVTTDKQPVLSSWQIWKPRILLLVAVFLPVFLETLDYTGESLTVMIWPHSHLFAAPQSWPLRSRTLPQCSIVSTCNLTLVPHMY
jgi:hypothetical protein